MDGRKNWQSYLKTTYKAAPNAAIWFHCASLGEFEQGRPLMERIKQEQPQQIIVVTFFSPSLKGKKKGKHSVRSIFPLMTYLAILQVAVVVRTETSGRK